MATPITPQLCVANRDLGEPRLSPDGSLVAFTSGWGGRSAICVVPSGGGLERAVTTYPEPRPGRGGGSYRWLPDGRGLVYTARDGDLWLQPFPGGEPRRITQVDEDEAVSGPAVDPRGELVAYVVDLAELWVVRLADGASHRVATGGDFVVDPAWAPDGSVLWHEWSVPSMAWDESRIGRHPAPGDPDAAADLRRVTWTGAPGQQAQQPSVDVHGRVWSARDDHGWLNVWCDDRPAVPEEHEHAGPTWGPGQRSYAVSPDGRRVAFSRNEDGFGRLCVAELGPDGTAGTVSSLGKGVHSQLSWVGGSIAAVRSGATTPPQLVVYDAGSGARRCLAHAGALGWDDAELVEPEPVAWRSGDGVTVPGRLMRPPGGGDGRLVCWLHGGPTDQWQVSFMPRVAYWVAKGWTVLIPDFRGSTGHGRAHQQAMREAWGVVDVADTIAGIRHAHRSGWGRPERTVAMGGSAGGFTVLHLTAEAPELLAAAVTAYPVSDLVALDETTHRFEAHYNRSLVGSRPGAGAEYRRRSPLTFAERIGVPLLVLHGDEDPVVGVDQSRALVERITAAGGTAELHVYEGEGHGFRQPEHQLDEYRRTEGFVARFLA